MGEIIFLLVCFVFFFMYFFQTSTLPKESVAFPYTILVICGLIGIYLLFNAYKKFMEMRKSEANKNSDEKTGKKGFTLSAYKLPMVIVLCVLYIFAWGLIGFAISTFLFLFLSMALFGIHVKKNLVISLISSVIFHVVFISILHVSMPVSILFNL